tara:strand:+ start:357 stop:644 length:288 start_codon:yes stop_codon:yes gene_type:complete
MVLKIIINNKYLKVFDKFPISIGRRDDNDLALNDMLVSRIHCAIYNDSDTIFIADMKSTNGTYVNKKKLDLPMLISTDDLIVIGETILKIQDIGN